MNLDQILALTSELDPTIASKLNLSTILAGFKIYSEYTKDKSQGSLSVQQIASLVSEVLGLLENAGVTFGDLQKVLQLLAK